MSERRPPRLGRPWVFISAAWIGPAILAMVDQLAQARFSGEHLPARYIVWQGGDWLLYGALTPLVFWFARRLPLRSGQLRRNVPIHFVLALSMCALWAGSGLLLRSALGLPPMADHPSQAMLSWFFTTLPFGVAVYFAVLGVEHALFYFAESRERQVHAAVLSSQLAEARLGALRAQLHPHFLFNSLNAITVLVRDQDTATAVRMLEQLGEILRLVLQTDRANDVRLSEEIGFLERYLAIEQIRFSDRLRAAFEVNVAVNNALVPAFVLQPLVENALRHGLARRTEGGALVIAARREGADLVLEVRNDGPPLEPATSEGRSGLGLANTRERLATMFGDRGRLTLINLPGGVLATVRLPYREAARTEGSGHG